MHAKFAGEEKPQPDKNMAVSYSTRVKNQRRFDCVCDIGDPNRSENLQLRTQNLLKLAA